MSSVVISGDSSGTVTLQAPAVAGTTTLTLPTTTGTVALTSQIPTGLTLGTPVASTSGTAIDFGSLPAGIKQVVISFDNVSFTGDVQLGVRLGSGGTPETTGYRTGYGSIGTTANTTSGGFNNSTGGFLTVILTTASSSFSGTITLTLLNSSTNKWACSGVLVGAGSGAAASMVGGTKALTGALNIVRIYGGTFDSGEINIAYI